MSDFVIAYGLVAQAMDIEYEAAEELVGRLSRLGVIVTTPLEVEEAVCASEVAGSGHTKSTANPETGMPCDWHRAHSHSRIEWLIRYLSRESVVGS